MVSFTLEYKVQGPSTFKNLLKQPLKHHRKSEKMYLRKVMG
jgi:hypothetical protein